MSSKQFFIDAVTRHTVFLQRYAGGTSKSLEKHLNKIRREINKELRGRDLSAMRIATLNRLLKKIDTIAKVGFNLLREDFKKEMLELAEYEMGFTHRMIEKGTTAKLVTPAQAAIKAAVSADIFLATGGKGVTLNRLLGSYSRSKRREIAQIIKDGLLEGNSADKIARKLSERTKHLQRRQLKALVVTASNKISDEMRLLTIKENRDIVQAEQWVSTLDSRTSAGCKALDGKTWPLDKAPIRPGYHVNCRSNIIPVVKDKFNLPIKGDRIARGPDGRERTTHKTYGSWLDHQPKSFQIESLGEKKRLLFKKGKLPLDKFVDKNYRELSLKELKRLEPLAFERAGLT